jgi:thiosulfate reductase cytochrome b subunit
MAAVISDSDLKVPATGHAGWIRVSHWVLAASVVTLAFSGFVILMAHPRLYWGNAGNDLTPALVELPFGRNYKHGGWEVETTFASGGSPIISSVRTYDIFNQNGWARSLHFLAAWFMSLTALLYLAAGLVSGHLWRDIVPRLRDFAPGSVWRDIRAHLRLPLPRAPGGPPYGNLQRLSYAGVVLVALPLMIASGLTMSPAVTAAYPGLLDFFGGSQSARTIHFLTFAALVLFVVVHVLMVMMTGFRRQIRAMTIGD